LEQVVKLVPTIGGGTEAAATNGVVYTLMGHCSAALNDLLLVDFLQIIIQLAYKPVSR
jgi:hypothetical protein